MTPRNRRRLGALLLGIASFLPFLDVAPASGSPVDDKRAEAQRIASRLDALGERMSVIDEQYNQAQLRLAKSRQAVTTAEAKTAETAKRLDQVEARARERAVVAYMGGGSLSKAAQVMQSDGKDMVLRNEYLTSAAGDDRAAVDALKAAREDLDVQKADLARQTSAAASAAARVAASRRDAAKAVAEQQALLNRTKGELDRLVQAEAARRAAAASARARAQIAARQAGSRARSGGSRASRGYNDPPVGIDAPPASSGAGAAVAEARRQLGKPYEYGGSGPDSFDCSGLTSWAWRAGGVSLPHSSGAQYSATTRVPLSDIQPGDLAFYGSPIHHVGIYVGGGQMIEAPHSGTNVRYASIYRSDMVGVGRPG